MCTVGRNRRDKRKKANRKRGGYIDRCHGINYIFFIFLCITIIFVSHTMPTNVLKTKWNSLFTVNKGGFTYKFTYLYVKGGFTMSHLA